MGMYSKRLKKEDLGYGGLCPSLVVQIKIKQN